MFSLFQFVGELLYSTNGIKEYMITNSCVQRAMPSHARHRMVSVRFRKSYIVFSHMQWQAAENDVLTCKTAWGYQYKKACLNCETLLPSSGIRTNTGKKKRFQLPRPTLFGWVGSAGCYPSHVTVAEHAGQPAAAVTSQQPNTADWATNPRMFREREHVVVPDCLSWPSPAEATSPAY